MDTEALRGDGSGSPVDEIVRAVAAAAEVDPAELPPLYDAVDPDAIAALVESADSETLIVRFEYCGYDVTVDGSGRVSVSGTADR